VLVLPFVEQQNLYQQFKLDEAWDSPHNLRLLAQMPRIYAPVRVKTREPYTTFYQAFVGKDAAFEVMLDPNSPFGARGLGLNTFVDGTSNTIWLAEASEPVPWTKPADIAFDGKKNMRPKLGGVFKDGFHVGFADGSTRFIREVDEDTLHMLIQRNDGGVIPPDKIR
jgi:hypothetical protein